MEIIIRKAKKGDAKEIVANRNESFRRGLEKYTGSQGPFGPEHVRRYDATYVANRKNEFVLVAIDKKSGKIVGNSGFFAKEHGRTRHRGEMGWGVHPDYMGMGIATKLVEATLKEAQRRGFTRAEAEAAVKNTASVKLAVRCGFKIEGKRKNGLLLDDGKYADTYLFGKILR
jgi:RimJ/RimL family protein N-acetyltransferase